MKEFKDICLNEKLLNTITSLGFKEPTEIQIKSIPLILEGKDILGESATGSGKTLAFGCGVINKSSPGQGLQTLILTPTRELTEQVKNSIKDLANKTLKVIAVYGGVSINPQIHELRKSEVVVATPGRLLDHLQRGTINLSKIKLLILDEADRMFDMGFIDDIKKIIQNCPKDRQTLLFSATVSRHVADLSRSYMKNPIRISAVKQVDPSKLKQVYYNVSRNTKLSLLITLLKQEREGLVMVFCNTRRTTGFVTKNLKLNNVKAIAIHGGLTQNKRSNTIELFNKGKFGVLVCTDIAARGLHIDNVSHIYNYEIPKDATDYVHRIGRTARAGEEGKAINLLCDYDHDNFSRIIREHRAFSIGKQENPEMEKVMIAKESSGGFSGGFNKNRRQSRSRYPSPNRHRRR